MNASEKCCQGCNGLGDKPENLVNFLHNPIAPYFSSAYVTIISIVCGVALAAVFYTAIENGVVPKDNYHPVIIWELLITIVLTAMIWHGYIEIIQYKAWPINTCDTLIPMSFSVLIALLSLCVEDTRCFLLVFSALCVLIAIAYRNCLYQLKRNAVINVYNAHYQFYGGKFYLCIFKTLIDYIEGKYAFFRQTSVCFLVLTIAEFFLTGPHFNELDSYVACTFITAIAWYFFTFDFKKELKKIKCLSEYY